MKTIYFVEKYFPQVKELDGEIIAIMPEVCRRLDMENVAYHTFEEFYDMLGRKQYSVEYLDRLHSWIDAFDDFIADQIPDTGMRKHRFVRLYGYYIQSVIEAMIIGSKNIISVVESLSPQKVVLVRDQNSQYIPDWEFFIGLVDYSCYLLPSICKEKNIDYSVGILEGQEPAKSNNDSLGSFIKDKIWSKLRIIKKVLILEFEYFKSKKTRKELSAKGKNKKILIINEDWTGEFFKDVIRQGHQVVYHTTNGPRRYPSAENNNDEYREKKIRKDVKELWKNISSVCLTKFGPSKFSSAEAGVNLASVLDEVFVSFLEKTCSIIYQTITEYAQISNNEEMEYAILGYKITPTEFGAVSHWYRSPKKTLMQVEHGSGGTQNSIWLFTEQPADLYVTSSIEEKEYDQKLFNKNGKHQCTVVAGRGWIQRYQNEAVLRSEALDAKRRNDCNGPEIIYYLPSAQSIIRFNCAYPLCWTYLLQKTLCQYFATLSEYNFVVKMPCWTERLAQPTKKYIDQLNSPNLMWKDGDLVQHLKNADRVITDYPSTPTFEARLLGIPTLSLYHESLELIPEVFHAYEKTTLSFKSFNEAKELVKRFVHAEPEEYIVDMKSKFQTPRLIEIFNESQKTEEYCKA